MDRGSILIVEDEPSAAHYLALTLGEAGYAVRIAGNGIEALRELESEAPDLIFSDLQMPVMSGLELLRHTKQRWPAIPFIMITVADDVATVVDAMRMGAVNYLLKPASPPAIQSAVARAMLAPSPPPSGCEGSPEIIGVSRDIVEVRHLIALAARNDVNVLIIGTTGTGKELVAKAIHRCSSLSGAPLVAHNCAATPHDLFESQFFGHRRGAFTGADQDQVGLFERAHGGILFLDELESLTLPHQAKLLRVIDDGEVRPVGSTDCRHVQVRLLAATNRDPAEMLAQGTLRDDLYYRLRGFEIRLPPLKDRPEDIPLLAGHFLAGTSASLSPDAVSALTAQSWPGNVRQLRNVIHSAATIAAGGRIHRHHLILEPCLGSGVEAPLDGTPVSGRTTLRERERQAILDALRASAGNRSRAAKVLGIDRSTLRRKLHEFGS